jgi:tetratricopeptide (TPR) repeat protein
MPDDPDAGNRRAWLLPESREGYALLESGRHDDALAAFRRAYDHALGLRDEVQACAAAHMIAVQIARLKLDVAERHRWNVTALEHADAADHEIVGGWYASLFGSLGITHRLLGRKDEALVYLERGRSLAESLPDDDYGRMVRKGIASQLAMLAGDSGAGDQAR